ncbi:MAG: response regulator transcription factor [Dehalococcoidia bacterium]
MISVVLADDHHVVRMGIKALLESEADIRVSGEAGSGAEAVTMAGQLKPDVMIVDLMLADMSGLAVVRQVRKKSPHTTSVVLSMYGNDCYVVEALQAGACSYVLKDSSPEELVRAVREASLGRRYLAPPLSDRAIEAYLQRTEDSRLEPYDMLTSREREVLHLAAQGFTSSNIAERLFISPRTVEVHRARVMQKLGLRNRTELIHFAIRRGIIPEK